MRGRPFELGNTFGQGRPPGSPNKKGLMLQRLLLENGDKIIKTLIDRAKKGDRGALALCVERLIPRLKDVTKLPFDDPQPMDAELVKPFLDGLTEEELELLNRITMKLEAFREH